MSSDSFMDEFARERNAALRSLDGARIRAYARKYDARLPAQDGLVFWASVHRARLTLECMTEDEKAVSRAWLADHGFRPGPL